MIRSLTAWAMAWPSRTLRSGSTSMCMSARYSRPTLRTRSVSTPTTPATAGPAPDLVDQRGSACRSIKSWTFPQRRCPPTQRTAPATNRAAAWSAHPQRDPPTREGDPDDHGDAAERVEPVIPGRREERRGVRPDGDSASIAEQDLLENAPAEPDRPSYTRGRHPGVLQREQGFAGDPEGEQDQHQGDPRARHGLEPRVAVRVLAIGGALREEQGPHEGRRDRRVDQRMSGVGDQGQRMPEHPAEELDQPRPRLTTIPQVAACLA